MGAAVRGVCSQQPSRSLKKLITQHLKQKREFPEEEIQVVSTRTTKTGMASSGAKREIFKKEKQPRIIGRKNKVQFIEFFPM